MDASTLKSIAEIIQACTGLLWPIVVLIAIIVFKSPIESLLYRLRQGKFFGQDFQFDQVSPEKQSPEDQQHHRRNA